MVMGNDLLPVLIFAVIFYLCDKVYKYGYNKGREDERNERENRV